MSLPGAPCYHFPSVTSTMDELTRLAVAGAPEGTTVIADQQERGRGRSGRSWITPPGVALLCSVLLRPKLATHRISLLPIVAGLAIAETIESVCRVTCQMKWPNDVLIAGAKVAGILAQTRAIGESVDHVNLGFGINLNTERRDLPEGATSLLVETGFPTDRDVFARAVLSRLGERYTAFCRSNGELDLDQWRRRAYLIGENVQVVDNDRVLMGRHRGIDANGSLLLETASGLRAVVAGDLTRGPKRIDD